MMLSYDEILVAVEHLTPQERVALIEATTRMLREDLRQPSYGLAVQIKQSQPLKSVEELCGSLRPDGPELTDEQLDQMRYDYLTEKYGA